ncbi:MAG: hypothetical protein Q9157_006549 [Trypethelium eluteriae]
MSPRSLGGASPGTGSKAFNSVSFGYGVQSVMAPKQEWWTDERIRTTVTKDYILKKLRIEEREQLFSPISFDGLTDDTYLDWILNKARRLFLILATIGLPGQIFAVLNASWDDDDLPLSRDDVRSLRLSERNDEKLNSRFFTFQHSFCLRELRRGSHFRYADSEIIPVEFVSKAPSAAPINGWECCRPVSSKKTFVRRRFSIGESSYQLSEEEFIDNVNRAKEIEHKHIANAWASYIWRNSGYVVTTFVGEHTLKSFMDQKAPQQFQKLSKLERTIKLQEWINCLSHATKTLHDRGWPHTEIRPSNILIDAENNVAFSDVGSVSMFQTDKKQDDQEVYNYSPPENFSSTIHMPAVPQHRESKISTTSSSGSSAEGPTSGGQAGSRDVQVMRSPEKADIFSLGCIFLDILTYLMEGKLSGFTKQRSSKRKNSLSLPTSGITSAPSIKMGSSKTDTSFHANLVKIDSWIKHLSDESCEYDDREYRGVPRLLKLVRSMLSQNPQLRPSAQQVCERVSDALTMHSGIHSPHCVVDLSREESEEQKSRKLEFESTLSQQQPMLNATNLFRMRNASNAATDIRKRDATSVPPLRDTILTSIPPSPPRTESPVSPVSPEDSSPIREFKTTNFPPPQQFSPTAVPLTTSPPRSVPQYAPWGVPPNVSSFVAPVEGAYPSELRTVHSPDLTSTSFLSCSPKSVLQQPMPGSASPVSFASMYPLGIIHDYANPDFPTDPYASQAIGEATNSAAILEPNMHPMTRTMTAPNIPIYAPTMQRWPSSTSSGSSSRAFPPFAARPGGSTTVSHAVPASSLSPALPQPSSPAPHQSFSHVQHGPKRSQSLATSSTHSRVSIESLQAPSPAPTGALPAIPGFPLRTSSTRAPGTAPLPPPTSALPPVPSLPPTTTLPHIPHPRHQKRSSASYIPQDIPFSSPRPAPTPPVRHPPLVQMRSAPDAVPQVPNETEVTPSIDAPQIPPKSPHRRARALSHARSGSDLLLDDTLSAWKQVARTPEQMPHTTLMPEHGYAMAEGVHADLGTLSGGGFTADMWRDYYIHA